MATWTDGAAYAPIERPDGFATPEAPPLPAAEPAAPLTPGSIPPPRDFAPTGPGLPLEAIQSRPKQTRNPGEPFAVASGMLSAGAIGREPAGTRDPRQAFASASYGTASTATAELPPPSGAPLPPPVGEPLPVPVPGGLPYAAAPPLPGQTPMWGQPVTQGAVTSQHRTLLGLALATLVLALLVPAAAPVLLVIAGTLTLRTRPLTGSTGAVLIPVGLGLVLLSALIDQTTLAPISRLVVIVAAVVLGLTAQRAGRRPRPPQY